MVFTGPVYGLCGIDGVLSSVMELDTGFSPLIPPLSFPSQPPDQVVGGHEGAATQSQFKLIQ